MLKLKKLAPSMETEFFNYLSEWTDNNEIIVPASANPKELSFSDFLSELALFENQETCPKGLVSADTYFLVNEDDRILGAINIRHRLNDYLSTYGGHIGYGIRPSVRRKGYATQMLKLALPLVKELGISRVMISCKKWNIGSAKTIMNNNGILENEIIDGDELLQRYYIENT